MDSQLLLSLGVFLVALAYSSVGHGGASGYLALLSFTAITARDASTLALTMNIGVSGIAFFFFRRAQHFDWKLAWPFLALSIPLAFCGALYKLSDSAHKWVLGAVLIAAAAALIFRPSDADREKRPVSIPLSLAVGGTIGLFSGMIGIGGGIFLSPVLILMGWADAKKTAAISSAFIFLNSTSGLIARSGEFPSVAAKYAPLICLAIVGAIAGGMIGANRLPAIALRRVLGVVLLFAIPKLFL